MNKFKTDNLSIWNDVHVFYDMYENDMFAKKDKIISDECKWRNEALNNTPHGRLLKNNSFFESLKSKKIYLAHVTPNFHNISKNNLIYPSSGCLVASIYCTPIKEENGNLRLHNLGKYILGKEMPMFLNEAGQTKKGSLKQLLFEIEIPPISRGNLVGIDYLRLGEIHYQSFINLEYLLSSSEKQQIQNSCVTRIRKSLKYLCTCNRAYYTKENFNLSNFMDMFIENIDNLPILGYFYFEILSEYIMLHQDNKNSLSARDMGEFYTETYKDLVFSLCSNLLRHFSLTQFKPTLKQISNYISAHRIFKQYKEADLKNYLVKRLIFLTNARLLDHRCGLLNWEHIRWNFEDLSSCMKPLIGHLIHRELRVFGRYPDFYFYFDQLKALQIWNYWNQLGLVIPFNGIIPKGEVGINPAYPDLKYKVYLSKTYYKDHKVYVEPTKKQDIQIVPRLIDPRFTSMGENKKESKN